MITKIKTNQIVKLLNTFDNPIPYEDTEIKFSIKNLEQKLANPNNELYFPTENKEDNFYKNLALSIINYDESSHIILDFENESNLIPQGISHLLSAHYLSKTHVFVDIIENTAGKSYIKNKKLDLVDANTNLAIDSFFIDDKNSSLNINKNFFNVSNIQTEDDIFKFYMDKIKDSSQKLNNSWSSKFSSKDFMSLIHEIPEELKKNTSFLTLLFSSREIFEQLVSHSKPLNSAINFENEDVKNLILNNPKFLIIMGEHLLEKECLKEKEIETQRNRLEDIYPKYSQQDKIDSYINKFIEDYEDDSLSYKNEIIYSEEFINHLSEPKTHHTSLGFISSNYSYFPEKLKNNPKIALNYIASQTSEIQNEPYIYVHNMKNVPPSVLFKEDFLSSISATFSYEELFNSYQSLKKKDRTLPNIELSQEYLFSNIKKIQVKDFDYLMKNIYHKIEVTDEFLLKVLEKNQKLHSSNIFHNKFLNLDFLIQVDQIVTKKYGEFKISKELLKTHISAPNLTESQELFLTKALIKNGYFAHTIDSIHKDPEHFSNKFLKPEVLFLHQFNHWSCDPIFNKTLKTLKTPEDFMAFINQIDSTAKKLDINPEGRKDVAKFIYIKINNNIKNDYQSIVKLVELYKNYDLPLEESHTLIFNKKFSEKILEWGKHNLSILSKIPMTAYYDKEFLQKFAKSANINSTIIEYSPIEVQNFFKSKKKEETYSEFLQKLLFHSDLKNNILEKKDNQPKEQKQFKI